MPGPVRDSPGIETAAAATLLCVAALLAAGCAISVPTPPPPSPGRASPAPSRPAPPLTPSPSPSATLHPGGLARVLTAMTGKSASEIQNAGSETLNSGAIVFIIGGPRDAGGTRTWLMTTEAARAPGWFPAQDANGDSTITALSPNCPDTTQTLTLDDLRPLGRIGSLACFGSTDIQLTGHVECLSGTEDGGLGGTSWQFDGVHCYMGGDYTIYGKAMTRELDQAGDAYPLAGTYLVRGHFDDPESNNCGFYQFATSILEHVGDAAPVMECRKQFVATSVTKIDE